MSLSAFVVSLFEDGRVRVASPGDPSEAECNQTRELLVELEQQGRTQFPGEPPSYLPEVGLWGAMLFYRGCQLAVYREWGAENVQAAFGSTCPAEIGAAAHYSVDLTWQFLPDLHRLTRQASPNDPLVEAIRHFATQWPLSSVGIAGIAPISLAGIVDHPGLLRLYADRIIGREDVSRLADPAVCEAVQTALGAHTCLAPKFYQALHTPSLQSKTAQNLATGDNT